MISHSYSTKDYLSTSNSLPSVKMLQIMKFPIPPKMRVDGPRRKQISTVITCLNKKTLYKHLLRPCMKTFEVLEMFMESIKLISHAVSSWRVCFDCIFLFSAHSSYSIQLKSFRQLVVCS